MITTDRIKELEAEKAKIDAQIEQVKNLAKAREDVVKLVEKYKYSNAAEFLAAIELTKEKTLVEFISELSPEQKKEAIKLLKAKKGGSSSSLPSNPEERKKVKEASDALLKKVWERNKSLGYAETLKLYLSDEEYKEGYHIKFKYIPASSRIKKWQEQK